MKTIEEVKDFVSSKIEIIHVYEAENLRDISCKYHGKNMNIVIRKSQSTGLRVDLYSVDFKVDALVSLAKEIKDFAPEYKVEYTYTTLKHEEIL